jgi:carboxyl-terminal processing protease
MIFHFATEYRNAHTTIDSANRFALTEDDMKGFNAFLATKGYTYTSPEIRALEKIKSELEKKQQFDELKTEFNALNDKLNSQSSTYFNQHKMEIKSLLEHEIIGRYYFQKGQSVYGFRSDEVVTKGVAILNDPVQYKSFLKITRD